MRTGARLVRSADCVDPPVLPGLEDDPEDLGFEPDVPSEVIAYEESLPDDDDGWSWEGDEYSLLWRASTGTRGHWEDGAPEWERSALDTCSRCGEGDDLDPLGTCARCRSMDGRCAWCGLDAVVYVADEACRTCYQRLRRNRPVTATLALRLSMLEAAFLRADLRFRRSGPH